MTYHEGTDTSAADLAATYFRAWLGKDFDTLRTILADDATFRGPLGTAGDADACVRGLGAMAAITSDIVVRHVFVDGPDVLTWYDLYTTLAPAAATANWIHVDHGKITRIEAVFDARELSAAMGR